MDVQSIFSVIMADKTGFLPLLAGGVISLFLMLLMLLASVAFILCQKLYHKSVAVIGGWAAEKSQKNMVLLRLIRRSRDPEWIVRVDDRGKPAIEQQIFFHAFPSEEVAQMCFSDLRPADAKGYLRGGGFARYEYSFFTPILEGERTPSGPRWMIRTTYSDHPPTNLSSWMARIAGAMSIKVACRREIWMRCYRRHGQGWPCKNSLLLWGG